MKNIKNIIEDVKGNEINKFFVSDDIGNVIDGSCWYSRVQEGTFGKTKFKLPDGTWACWETYRNWRTISLLYMADKILRCKPPVFERHLDYEN